jgi:hypothetical protein
MKNNGHGWLSLTTGIVIGFAIAAVLFFILIPTLLHR